MKKYHIVCCIVFAVLLTSCFKKALSPKEYFNWAKTKESGLLQVKKGKGVSFNLKYLPSDLIVSNEIKNGITPEYNYQNRKVELGNLAYFLLKIESAEQDLLMHNLHDEQEYVRRVNYYSLDFQQEIIAIAGKDTIPCVLYQFENSYGIAPYVNISLAFPGDFMEANKDSAVEILVNDQVFGNGIMRYTFEQNSFYDLPELIIE